MIWVASRCGILPLQWILLSLAQLNKVQGLVLTLGLTNLLAQSAQNVKTTLLQRYLNVKNVS